MVPKKLYHHGTRIMAPTTEFSEREPQFTAHSRRKSRRRRLMSNLVLGKNGCDITLTVGLDMPGQRR